jgi:hypothetical protein
MAAAGGAVTALTTDFLYAGFRSHTTCPCILEEMRNATLLKLAYSKQTQAKVIPALHKVFVVFAPGMPSCLS